MKSITIKSPAKVNLFLKITGKRKDGYHTLVTLFHRVSLSDALTLRKIPSGIRIRSNIKNLPNNSRNIIWRAFDEIQKARPFKGGVSVTVKKQIPIGGGMGGGSSNAASFILGLRRLYNLKIPQEKLFKIGAKLGADVNFFLADVNQALGIGTGERIKPLKSQKKLWFVIMTMPKPLLTVKVYKSLDLKRLLAEKSHLLTNQKQIARLLAGQSLHRNLNDFPELIHNDLQDACIRLYPAVQKVIQLFDQSGSIKTLVSGSGPTVLGLAKNRPDAQRIATYLQQHSRFHKKIFIAETV